MKYTKRIEQLIKATRTELEKDSPVFIRKESIIEVALENQLWILKKRENKK